MNDEKISKEEILAAPEFFDPDEFRRYRKIPISKRLKFLDETYRFFESIKPPESKRAWEKLKEMGY